MATTIIKGLIESISAPRKLSSGKWVQELVVVEKTKQKDHQHFVQYFSNDQPSGYLEEREGEEREVECYVNSHSYQHPDKGLKYSTSLSLKKLQ